MLSILDEESSYERLPATIQPWCAKSDDALGQSYVFAVALTALVVTLWIACTRWCRLRSSQEKVPKRDISSAPSTTHSGPDSTSLATQVVVSLPAEIPAPEISVPGPESFSACRRIADFPRGVTDFFTAILTWCLHPSWRTIVRGFGIDKHARYDPGLGPPRQVAADLGITGMHDAMGASCLLFMLPMLAFLGYWYCGMAGVNACPGLALMMSGFLVTTAIGSFLGDYWFSGYAKDSHPSRVPASAAASHETEEVLWWHKQMVANKIDNVNAYSISVAMIAVGIVQSLYAPAGTRWRYPLGFALFGLAAFIKSIGVRWIVEYDTTRDVNTLWAAWLLHSIWHLIASGTGVLVIYGLMVDGL